MYTILMDSETKSFYMEPREVAFHAFSSPKKVPSDKPSKARPVVTEISDKKELTTIMYNAGFSEGYIDGEKIYISKEDAYYYAMNYNEVSYAQFLLTGEERYLKNVKKSELLSVCKLSEEGALFPTVTLEGGKIAVLAYTDRYRIPQALFDKYPDYRVVKIAFSMGVFVNGKFLID